jgi:hypothetical protein
MADRILTWFFPAIPFPPSAPAYYVENDMDLSNVRIHALKAPTLGDCKIDIFADGVSIFNNNTPVTRRDGTSRSVAGTPDTTVKLPQHQTSEALAEDFSRTGIDAGTWVTCELVLPNGARNITVQLELNRLAEEGETE